MRNEAEAIEDITMTIRFLLLSNLIDIDLSAITKCVEKNP